MQPVKVPDLPAPLKPGLGRMIGEFLEQGFVEDDAGRLQPLEDEAEAYLLKRAAEESLTRQAPDISELADRALSLASHVKELEFQVDRIDDVIAGHQAAKRWLERKVSWLRQIVTELIARTGPIKLRESRGWGLGVSTRTTPGVSVTNLQELPSEYRRLTFRGIEAKFPPKALAWLRENMDELPPEPLKAELLKELRRSGEVLPGCEVTERKSLIITMPRPPKTSAAAPSSDSEPAQELDEP